MGRTWRPYRQLVAPDPMPEIYSQLPIGSVWGVVATNLQPEQADPSSNSLPGCMRPVIAGASVNRFGMFPAVGFRLIASLLRCKRRVKLGSTGNNRGARSYGL